MPGSCSRDLRTRMIVQEPYTVAYRRYGQNTIEKQEVIVEGILGLVRSERQGGYPGGSKSRWDRYAFIGGVASTYSVRYCWRKGKGNWRCGCFSRPFGWYLPHPVRKS